MVLKQLRRYVDDLICEHGEEYPCVSWTRLVEWTSISDNIMDNCSNLEELLAEMIQYWENNKAEELLSQEVSTGVYDKVGATENLILKTSIYSKAGDKRTIQLIATPHFDEKYGCRVMTYLVEGVSPHTIVSENPQEVCTAFDFADGPMYTLGNEFSNGIQIIGNIREIKPFQPSTLGNSCVHLVVEVK
jgi:hypothetical protein